MAVGIKEVDLKVDQTNQVIVDNDLTPFTGDIKIFRGEKIKYNFAIVDFENKPIDFTGDTFLLGIKDPDDMGGLALSSSTDDTGSTPGSGLISITIDNDTTEMNTFINFSVTPLPVKMELSAINAGEETRIVFQSDGNASTDANQLITSTATLIGKTIPILQLNPDAKLDAKAVAQTAFFTVPANTVFIPLKLHLLVTDITGAAVAPTVQFGTTADPDLLLVPELALLNAQYETQSWDVIGAAAIPAGEVLEFGITVGSTATDELIIPAFEGYLLSV